ncbi:FAD-dependent oxidoreductase [Paraconexibacter algicola]|uniref:D-amino-acid oxidase n=1 Tax=Paraconexibacter algicola TaxID=2133960 RepID=A0A2T4UM97_9ACTN|nr:FAD-dependent oxidoreductase [Paraconexibacter algicola]PTL60355.1 amino acid oxidase [Paraconexibacter algicola]
MVTVLGAGVLGLSCARALTDAGYEVRVLTDGAPTVSAIAGGLWLPYATGTDERVAGWALETLERLVADGHPVVDHLHLERREPWWVDVLPADHVRPATRSELPEGHARGWVARVPLVEMPRHLAALADGLRIERATVTALDDPVLGDGPVVLCTGLATRRLVDDPALHAIRGQVVHLDARGRDVPCVCDEDALTYVLPRADVCVVGGTHEPGDEDDRVRPAQTRDIVARAVALAPALAGAPVLGARAGLRPARHGGPRVERDGRVVHCYGHGGGGLTLSWGCARTVTDLLV